MKMRVVQVNLVYDDRLAHPEALLDRYSTLTGWSEAVAGAGAATVAVVQRFARDARIVRRGIEYTFCADGAAGRLSPLTASPAVARAVASLDPDIAHVNGLIFPAHTWTLRRHLPRSAALVVQNHSDGGAVGRAPLLRLAGRMLRRAADGFLFAVPEHATVWRHAGLIAPDQPTYEVMESSTTLRPDPATWGDGGHWRGRRSPAMLWVGRLSANKDPLTVLDGFERSLAQLPEAMLTMVYGEDDLLPAVKARVDGSMALRERVRLVGAVPHDGMPAYYHAADVFIVGSHHEGSGYALLEASACGVVPVVTDIPSFRALTGGGSVGALWTPGDAASCARALVDASRRDPAAERVRVVEHFEREFSWSAIGRRAVAIYREVIERRNRPPRPNGP